MQRALLSLLLFFLAVLGPSSAFASRPADASPQKLFSQGKFEQARLAYTQDIQQYPDQPAARLGLVRTLLRLDRWPEALDIARTTAKIMPGSADAQGLYALAALRAGDPDTAAQAAARAVALDRNSYWALVADGRLALWNDREAQARRGFRRATALRPSEPDGMLGLLLSEGFDEEGYKTAVAYLRLAPQGHPHELYVNSVRKFVKNWPALRHAYGTEVFVAVAPVREATLQAWRRTGASLSVTVPLQRRKGHWLIPVLINGQTFHLLFDTGAGGSVALSEEAARRLHLPILAHSQVSGIQGNAESSDLYAKTMTVGGLTLSSIPIDVVRQPTTLSDGLFGAAVLNRYSVTLDTDKGLMSIERGQAAGRRLASEEATVPFHLYRGNILTRAQVEGEQTWVELDTGSEDSFLSLRYARNLAALSPKAEVQEVVLHGSFGIGQTAEPVKAAGFEKPLRVSLGGKSLSLGLRSEDLELGLSVLDTQISPKYDFEVPLLLGAPYLDRFRRFTIDYPRRELRFVPAAPPASKEQTAANTPGPATPPVPKAPEANPILDPTRVPQFRIEQGYRLIWWTDQWVQLPQGVKLDPVAPALMGQPPPFAAPAGYVALRYKPKEAGVRWMLVPQASGTIQDGRVIIK